MIDTRLRSYLTAVKGLRQARDRKTFLNGLFAMAMATEKNPVLRGRMIAIYEAETEKQQPA